MNGIELIRTFREVATRRSFSRAAVVLGVSKATVSKHVAELEKRGAVRLLNRSTRSLSLTDAGSHLLERSAELLEMADRTLSELQIYGRQPQGRLQVSAHHGLVHGWLADAMTRFVSQCPDVYVSLRLTNRAIDLIDEGVDVALQIGPIEDQNLVVRRLVEFGLVVCASPHYWAARGTPKLPEDMRQHDVLTYSLMPRGAQLPFETDGKRHFVPVHSRMESSDAMPLIELATRGLGVACVPALMAQTYIDSGELVPALQQHMPQDLWLYAAYPQHRHNSAAMRVFLDFLEQALKAPGTATS